MQKPTLELRHFNAIVTLAEELSYTKAARRLGMSQSGLSRSIQDAERRLNRKIFDRNRSRVELTDAGRACVAEARLTIEHEERAIQFTKAVAHGVDSTLIVGRSQYTDPVLNEVLLSLHLPLHPNLDVQLHSEFAPELEHGVLHSRLDLALITHPSENPRLSTVKLTETPLSVYDDAAYGREVLVRFTDGTQLSVCVGVKQSIDARYCQEDTPDQPIFTRED